MDKSTEWEGLAGKTDFSLQLSGNLCENLSCVDSSQTKNHPVGWLVGRVIF